MCHFSGEVNEINDSLTVLSDGCFRACLLLFLEQVFRLILLRVLLWLHMVEHLQQHSAQKEIERKEKDKCRFSD